MIADSSISCSKSCDFVRSAAECEYAALQLGLTYSRWKSDDGIVDNLSSRYNPPFCYHEEGYRTNPYEPYEHLIFNQFGTNTGLISSYVDSGNDNCLCRQNDFCSKTPCGEGQGDCDGDAECEGSLVCGHRNCVNSSITDCCAPR